MATTPETKSWFRWVLSEIYARSFPTNNQQKCIDCLKSGSNKNELERKKCGCNEFYVSNF